MYPDLFLKGKRALITGGARRVGRSMALALGAILPPENQEPDTARLQQIPQKKWGAVEDVNRALLMLVAERNYVNGEIIHIDCGQHIV